MRLLLLVSLHSLAAAIPVQLVDVFTLRYIAGVFNTHSFAFPCALFRMLAHFRMDVFIAQRMGRNGWYRLSTKTGSMKPVNGC
jgi:hypothetical protein